jgi:hypothetical protein
MAELRRDSRDDEIASRLDGPPSAVLPDEEGVPQGFAPPSLDRLRRFADSSELDERPEMLQPPRRGDLRKRY